MVIFHCYVSSPVGTAVKRDVANKPRNLENLEKSSGQCEFALHFARNCDQKETKHVEAR